MRVGVGGFGYSTHMGEGATTAASDPERFFDVVRAAVQALDRAAIPHAVIGSAAHVAYVGECPIEDLDVLVKPLDADRVLPVLDGAGFRTNRTDPQWVYKAWLDGVLVDVIFRPPRSFRLTEEIIDRRRRLRIAGVEVWVLAPEDQVLLELASDAHEMPWHWRTALAILGAHPIDWSILDLSTDEENRPRVAAMLLYAGTEGVAVPWDLTTRMVNDVLADAGKLRRSPRRYRRP